MIAYNVIINIFVQRKQFERIKNKSFPFDLQHD